jgi:phosphoenolpyruvate carboxylase
VTGAVLVASTAAGQDPGSAAEARFLPDAERMAAAAEAAWRDLVERDGFPAFFARVSPLEELGLLPLGSRPARRNGGTDLASLRAIPWVFAWAQNRCNLPGWYGLGTGLAEVAGEPGGLDRLRAMAAEWPFFASLLDNAEMSLAKADPLIAGLYLDLGDRPDLVAAIREEYRRTRRLVLEVAGASRLLEGRSVLRRAVDLRNPYVDALSFLQVRFLSALRQRPDPAGGAELARLRDLVLLTVNGVAAGLQNTG